jgi:hypothetical protein
MTTNKVYLLQKISGQYDDYSDEVIGVFATKEAALNNVLRNIEEIKDLIGKPIRRSELPETNYIQYSIDAKWGQDGGWNSEGTKYIEPTSIYQYFEYIINENEVIIKPGRGYETRLSILELEALE